MRREHCRSGARPGWRTPPARPATWRSRPAPLRRAVQPERAARAAVQKCYSERAKHHLSSDFPFPSLLDRRQAFGILKTRYSFARSSGLISGSGKPCQFPDRIRKSGAWLAGDFELPGGWIPGKVRLLTLSEAARLDTALWGKWFSGKRDILLLKIEKLFQLRFSET